MINVFFLFFIFLILDYPLEDNLDGKHLASNPSAGTAGVELILVLGLWDVSLYLCLGRGLLLLSQYVNAILIQAVFCRVGSLRRSNLLSSLDSDLTHELIICSEFHSVALILFN